MQQLIAEGDGEGGTGLLHDAGLSEGLESLGPGPVEIGSGLVAQDIRRAPARRRHVLAAGRPHEVPLGLEHVVHAASGRPTRRRSSGRPAASRPHHLGRRPVAGPSVQVEQVEIHGPPPVPSRPVLRQAAIPSFGRCMSRCGPIMGPTSGERVAIRAVMFDFGGVDLDEPVRGIRPPGGGARPSSGIHPHRQRHQPRPQRLGAPGTQRDRHRRLRGGVGGRGAGPRTRARRPARAREAVGGDPPKDGRGHRRLPEGVQDGLPHQQFRIARTRRLRRGGRGVRPLRRRARIARARRPQTRSPLLRAGLRRHSAWNRGVGVPRRPRRQPQAGPAPRHAHHQGDRSRRGAGGAGGGARTPSLLAD